MTSDGEIIFQIFLLEPKLWPYNYNQREDRSFSSFIRFHLEVIQILEGRFWQRLILSQKRVSVSFNIGSNGRNAARHYGGGQFVDFTPILLVLNKMCKKMPNVTLFVSVVLGIFLGHIFMGLICCGRHLWKAINDMFNFQLWGLLTEWFDIEGMGKMS